MGKDRQKGSLTSPVASCTGEARETDLVRNLCSHSVLTDCRLQWIKELETADSIHVECITAWGYMQKKALVTPNGAQSFRVC